MSNLRTGIITVLALSLGGLYVADRLWGSHDRRDVEARLAELEQERDTLHQRSRSLVAEQARMRSQQRALAWRQDRSAATISDRGEAVAPVEPSMASPEDERSFVEPESTEPAPPPPTSEELQRGLEQAFEYDADDPSWSRGAEQQVLEGLGRALDEHTSLASVGCNGTMCRIESDHDDMSSFRSFAQDTLLGSGGGLWNGAIFTSVVDGEDGGGSVAAVTFVAREGAALPGIAR